MANHKSSEKRAKQDKKKRMNNKSKTAAVRTAVKELRVAITGADSKKAKTLLPKVQGLLAKLAKSSATNKNTAARKTSRLAAQVAKLK